MNVTANNPPWREDFPIFSKNETEKNPLAYLDNAATAQKPRTVLEAQENFYRHFNANIHRGNYRWARQATEGYEKARSTIAAFIGAEKASSCVFTKGATEGINLVAESFGRTQLKKGDGILLSRLEHHANIVPWQMLSEKIGARVEVVEMDLGGHISTELFEEKLKANIRFVAITHASNALGTIQNVNELVKLAHKADAKILIDAAQSVAHLPIDVKKMDCDFLVFSGHKLFGPTGIGILYAKTNHLKKMPPWQTGGDMIEQVSFEHTRFASAPARFEAGTPNISGAIALAQACRYLKSLDCQALLAHETKLLQRATEGLGQIKGIQLYGTAPKLSILAFQLQNAHAADVEAVLEAENIAIRVGHHCAMPLWNSLGLQGALRASFSFYNTLSEVDRLIQGVEKAQNLLSR